MMSVAEAIRTKRAVRQFTDKPISEEAEQAILNAGRRAQSSKNTQPWRFIAIRDKNTLAQLSKCGDYAGHLAGANLGIALVSTETDQFDLGQAAAYLQLAAWELGIGSCLAAMWDPEKAKAILGIPAEWNFHIAISFGYPAPQPERPPRPEGRKPLEEVISYKKW